MAGVQGVRVYMLVHWVYGFGLGGRVCLSSVFMLSLCCLLWVYGTLIFARVWVNVIVMVLRVWV